MKIEVGNSFERTVHISASLIQEFADVTGDQNPVHIDEEYAAKTRFKQRIAHGFLTGALLSRIIGTDFPGEGTLYLEQSMRFLHPVFIGDDITAEVRITEIDEKRRAKLTTIIKNQKGTVVLDGLAKILLPLG